jgi:Secretion system C-terminal sorting domain
LPGLDTVTYTVTNSCGFAVATYPINTAPCLIGVNTINPAGLIVEICPNPNSGIFTFKAPTVNDILITVSITNLLGAQLQQFNTTSNKTTDVKTSLPPGMYFLHAQSQQGNAIVKMVVE